MPTYAPANLSSASSMKHDPAGSRAHGLSLRANTIWYLVGNVAYTAAQWCMVVLVARLGSVEAVGVFSLAFAVTAPIVMFANLRLRFVQASDARNEHDFREYLALRLMTTVLALLVICFVVMSVYGRTSASLVAVIIGVAKSLEAISDVYYGYLQKHLRMDRIAVSLMAKSLLSVCLFGGILYASRDLTLASCGLVVAWGVVLFVVDSRAPAIVSGHGNRMPTVLPKEFGSAVACYRSRQMVSKLITLTRTAMPLGLVAFLVSLSTNIPRYFIEWEYGARALGLYSAISYLMAAGVTVLSSLGQSAVPRLADLFVQREAKRFMALLTRMLGIAAAAGLFGVVIAATGGREILVALYGNEYGHSENLFIVIMVAAALNYVALLLWYALTAMRAFQVQLPLFLGDVLLMTILSAVLVPRMGAIGGALAVVCVMGYHVMLGAGLIAREMRSARP